MITLSANTRFSYRIAKGTSSARVQFSEDLNRRVFQRIMQLYENKNNCGIGTIKNSYNALLPEQKQIMIKPLSVKEYDELGGGFSVEDEKDCLTGYSIEIPTNKKKKLNVLDISSFMHESTHVLDFLFNPKYIANIKKMYEMNIYEKEYYKIFQEYFYTTDLPRKSKKVTILEAESELRKALEKVPFDEKIVFLKYINNSLNMEYHAYNQDLKYAQILKKFGKNIEKESLADYGKLMFFPEKINMIKQIIREELLKQRSMI